MSLTSYRAAPSRVNHCWVRGNGGLPLRKADVPSRLIGAVAKATDVAAGA